VEEELARSAVAVAAARRELVAELNRALAATPIRGFRPPRLHLACPIAAQLAVAPALAVEEAMRERLEAGRSLAGRAWDGEEGTGDAADFDLLDPESGRRGAQLSSGEQKSFLLHLVLAHLALVRERRGQGPVLLLDEPFLHLDLARREALIEALAVESAQIFLTGAVREEFLGMTDIAAGWVCGEGALRRDETFRGGFPEEPAAAGEGDGAAAPPLAAPVMNGK